MSALHCGDVACLNSYAARYWYGPIWHVPPAVLPCPFSVLTRVLRPHLKANAEGDTITHSERVRGGIPARTYCRFCRFCVASLLQELTAERAHEILKNVSDEDCKVMGFNPVYARPDWMIISVLPVPPPPVRPSVMMDSASR